MKQDIFASASLFAPSEPESLDTIDISPFIIESLILKTLSLEAMHGFGVTKRIEQVSQGVFRVNPGSLLVAFQRLEREGLIDGEWRNSENNRRARFYKLTAKGRKRLNATQDDWNRRAAAIARLMEA